MIVMKELLQGVPFESLSEEVQNNLTELLLKINFIRERWKQPMIVTSGYRTNERHVQIYENENAKRKMRGLPPLRMPKNSGHLLGKSCDIYDPGSHLQRWTLDHVYLCENIGLWMEDFSRTRGWLHYQIHPPASGTRFFMP